MIRRSQQTHNARDEAHGTEGSVVGEDNAQTLTNKTLTEPIIEFVDIPTYGHVAEFMTGSWQGAPSANMLSWVGVGGSQYNSVCSIEARGTGAHPGMYIMPKGLGQVTIFGRGTQCCQFEVTGESTVLGALKVQQCGETSGVRTPVRLYARDVRNSGTGAAYWAGMHIYTDRGGDLDIETSDSTTNSRVGDMTLNSSGAVTITSGASTVAGTYDVDITSEDDVNIDSTTGDTNIDSTGGDVNIQGVAFKSGTGTPESAVTGNVGDLFIRTDGGAGTVLYVKESGTGNTGWAAK